MYKQNVVNPYDWSSAIKRKYWNIQVYISQHLLRKKQPTTKRTDTEWLHLNGIYLGVLWWLKWSNSPPRGLDLEALMLSSMGKPLRMMEIFHVLTSMVGQTFSKTPTVQLKWVHFITYKLHLIHLIFKIKGSINKQDVKFKTGYLWGANNRFSSYHSTPEGSSWTGAMLPVAVGEKAGAQCVHGTKAPLCSHPAKSSHKTWAYVAQRIILTKWSFPSALRKIWTEIPIT